MLDKTYCEEPVSLKLYIGSKRYSSWSLRPWFLMKQLDIYFSEEVIPFENCNNRREFSERTLTAIRKISPSKRVPSLHINNSNIIIHDSLAICETLNELYCERVMWPEKFEKRAQARAIANELHSQFVEVRKRMPLCCGVYATASPKTLEHKIRNDVDRIEEIINLSNKPKDGGYLFGRFSIADAMLAPYILRLHFYRYPVGEKSITYMDNIINNPNIRNWITAGSSEKPLIKEIEQIAMHFPDFGSVELKL